MISPSSSRSSSERPSPAPERISSRSSSSLPDILLKLITKFSGFCISWAMPAESMPREAIFSCLATCSRSRASSWYESSFIGCDVLRVGNGDAELCVFALTAFHVDGSLVVENHLAAQIETGACGL